MESQLFSNDSQVEEECHVTQPAYVPPYFSYGTSSPMSMAYTMPPHGFSAMLKSASPTSPIMFAPPHHHGILPQVVMGDTTPQSQPTYKGTPISVSSKPCKIVRKNTSINEGVVEVKSNGRKRGRPGKTKVKMEEMDDDIGEKKNTSKSRMTQLADGFEALRGIPFVLTVASDCSVWDYDVGWAGSIHDSVNFSRSELGRRCANGVLDKYCLVRDCAYPARPYMLVPFKGSKEGLPDNKYYWNFIQSSTRMPVERAFGMLKGRFRILLKRCDMELRNVPPLVVACLVMHNICLAHKDDFDLDWIQEAEIEVRTLAVELEAQRTAALSLSELQAVRPQTEEETIARGQNDASIDNIHSEASSVEAKEGGACLGHGVARRDNIAKVMYNEHTQRNVRLVFGNDSAEEESRSDMEDKNAG